MKKIGLPILITWISLMIFVACGNATDSDETIEVNDGHKIVVKKDGNGQVIFPLEEQVTLTAFVTTRPNVDNFEDNDFTRLLEEMTNVNLEFIVAIEDQASEELNLLLATGSYPDIILSRELNTTMQMLNGGQGILLPLNEMIEQQGVNTQEVLDEFEIAREMITMADGQIYNLPKVSDCYHCKSTQKLWIYQPWLDNLGLEMPKTTDEFYQVLKAFATMDPNGNGKSDEIPFAGAISGWETHVEGFIMNAFVYNSNMSRNGTERLYIDKGSITASYLDDGFKEGLKYLQKLRHEGLLAKESFTQPVASLKQMGENPNEVILGVFPGGSSMVATHASSGRWRDYVVVPPLMGPEGIQYAQFSPYRSVEPGFSITNKCQYPEVAFAIGDLLYKQTMTLESTIGRQGVDWQYVDDEKLLGINGEKAIWEELISWTQQDVNYTWSQMGNSYRPSSLRLGRYNKSDENLEQMLYNETKEKIVPYLADFDMVLPDIVLEREQSAQMYSYATHINAYVEEKVAEYIVTDIDIEEDWPSFQNELRASGVFEMLEILQEGYDIKNLHN